MNAPNVSYQTDCVCTLSDHYYKGEDKTVVIWTDADNNLYRTDDGVTEQITGYKRKQILTAYHLECLI